MNDDVLSDEFKAVRSAFEKVIEREISDSDEPLAEVLADLGDRSGLETARVMAEEAWGEAFERVTGRMRQRVEQLAEYASAIERGVPEGIAA